MDNKLTIGEKLLATLLSPALHIYSNFTDDSFFKKPSYLQILKEIWKA